MSLNTITGIAKCIATTTSAKWEVTWTVTNLRPVGEVTTANSPEGGPSVIVSANPISIPASGSGTFIQDLPPSANDAELNTSSTWTDGTNGPSDGLTVFSGTCAVIPTGSVTVKKLAPDGQVLAGADFTLSSNAIPVQSGVTEMPGGTVTFAGLKYGNYIVTETAPPPGYSLASPASVAVTINSSVQYVSFTDPLAGLPQVIIFKNPGVGTPGEKATLSATGGASGNPVIFSLDPSSQPGVCSVSGTTVTYIKVGTCVIDANQAGNSLYSAAPQVSQSVPITLPTGYDLCGRDGGVFVFPTHQTSGFFGSLPGIGVHVNNIVGMVPTADGEGYFLVGSDGGVFAFGDAPFENSLPGIHVHVSNIVGIVPTADDRGYLLVGSDGSVFAFGDASFFGSLTGSGVHVSNIIGIAVNPGDTGYLLVGATGAVYAFGNADNFGSVTRPPSPVTSIQTTPDGGGYWIVTQNGAVYAFGDAQFFGSLPHVGVSTAGVVGIVPTGDNGGYWLVGLDGGVFAFGNAPFFGSLPQLGTSVANIVGAVPTHH